ncbi:MAG TPA: hypothetical protein VLB74_07575, partial [Flavobacterium sp.]|nr:hypothetical protein [Flavobacterium sp.]
MTKKIFFAVLLLISFFGSSYGQTCNGAVPIEIYTYSITTTSATFSWPALAMDGQQWEVLILPANAPEPNSTTIPTAPTFGGQFTATGLMSCSSYKFYVRTVCSPGNVSVWSMPIYFTTIGTTACPFSVTISATLDIPTSNLFANINSGTGPFTYQWSLNGNPIPGATSQNLFINGQGGTYQLTVTDSTNLTVTASITIQGITIIAN